MTQPRDPAAAVRFRAAADRLVNRVGHWTPERWARPVAAGSSRADRVHGLVQHIADLTADVEGLPRRPVPRLENDLALADQIRVLVADLVLADPPPDLLLAAADAIETLDLG